MSQSKFSLNARAVLLMAISAAYPVVGYGAPAARVDFSVGNVTATGSNGQSRTLGKGAQIEQGDTVNTNGGRAQLRFTDGAYVSLQPESQFRIDQYQFNGKTDGSEKGLFSLLKGGLRTITGLVGRTNKANYQVRTVVATIGIRGTEYTIQYGQSITGTVGEGEIEVCNGAGCLSVTNGESYYVQSQEVKPVLTAKRTDLPPPEPEDPPANFAQGEEKDAGGNPSPGFILTGTLDLTILFGELTDGFLRGSLPGTFVFDADGNLRSEDVGSGSVALSSVRMYGNDGIVAWGTHLMPSGSTFPDISHFVAGLPVPGADLSALGGTVGSYTLAGSTPVTDGIGTAVGVLNSATFTADFTGPSAIATADMAWTLNGSPLNARLTGPGAGASFFLSGSCGGTCNVEADALLFGPNAIRAGMVYGINDTYAGSAAFAKQ